MPAMTIRKLLLRGAFVLLLVAIMLLVMIVGTAMDMTPTILILTPVLMPVVKAAGIDPVYFGVLFIINNAIGLITPPVGTVLYTVCSITRCSIEDYARAFIPFLLALVGALLVGLVDTYGRAFLPVIMRNLFEPSVADNVAASLSSITIYLLMALVLIWRPRGLFQAYGS